MSEGNDFLPHGWVETSLGDLGDWKGGGTPSKSNSAFWTGGNVPWVSPKDMKRFYLDDADDKVTSDAVKNSSAQLFPSDSVLVVARSGILERTLPVAINRVPVATNQDLKTLIPKTGVDSRYVAYFLKGSDQHIREECAKAGTTVASIDLSKLKAFRCALPPLAEQRRIVAKIEVLQERSQKAREALAEVGPLLEQFRQSLLAAAFRGDLTADWRAANPNVEPASELLTRIRQERRQKWEQSELAKYEAKGKLPPKGWQEKYEEPARIDDCELPELPLGWCWTSFESLTESFDNDRIPVSLVDRDQRSGRYPYYGASGIIDDIDDFLFDGDFLLIGEDGANLLARSTPIAFLARGKFWVNNHAHVSRTLGGVTLQYVEAFINGISLQPYVTGSAQPKLTQKNLNRIPIALAPLNEHKPILKKIEASLAMESNLNSVRVVSESDLTQLDQSILAKAFRGELVPQDPNDEPASVLLERIRNSRDASNNDQKRKSKRPSGKSR